MLRPSVRSTIPFRTRGTRSNTLNLYAQRNKPKSVRIPRQALVVDFAVLLEGL